MQDFHMSVSVFRVRSTLILTGISYGIIFWYIHCTTTYIGNQATISCLILIEIPCKQLFWVTYELWKAWIWQWLLGEVGWWWRISNTCQLERTSREPEEGVQRGRVQVSVIQIQMSAQSWTWDWLEVGVELAGYPLADDISKSTVPYISDTISTTEHHTTVNQLHNHGQK